MYLSLVVGIVATVLGVLAIATGVAVTVITALRPAASGAFPAEAVIKIGKLLVEMMKAFAKLTPAAQLLFAGLVLFGAGLWLLIDRPF